MIFLLHVHSMRAHFVPLTLALAALPACSDADYACRSGARYSACISKRDVRAFDSRIDAVDVSISNVTGMHAFSAMIGDSLVAMYEPRAAGHLDSLNRVVNVRGHFRKEDRDERARGTLVMMEFRVRE